MTDNNVSDIYALSPLQRGILLHSLQAPESGMYFEQFSATFEGAIEVEHFRAAWQRVVDHHPALRTTFFREGLDQPLQVVHKSCSLPWIFEDWRGHARVDAAARLEAFLVEDRRRGFDLERAPLLRVALFRTDDEIYEFVLSFHHILLDGWSTAIVQRDVALCYDALRRGEECHLEAPRPYRDYIRWLEQQDPAGAEAFWRATLQGFSAPTPVSMDWIPGTLPGSEDLCREQVTYLAEDLTSGLQAVARGHGLTLNTLVQGAWALLLSRYSGETDIVFGMLSSGRPAGLNGVTSMVGLFLNALPMRARIQGEDVLVDWLARLQQRQIDMRQYEYAPLVAIHGWSGVPRRLPMFESLLAFESYPTFASSSDGVFKDILVRGGKVFERTNYPLHLVVRPGSQLKLRILHDSRCLDEDRARRMLAHLQTLLEGIHRDPRQRVSDLQLLTAAERRQILVEWNDTATDYPRLVTVPQMFDEQVNRSPDSLAVACGGLQLSYRELDECANRIASRLRQRGVGADMPVGVLLERSPSMIAGWLGVLKAGGAYVPLDPEYPDARLAFMLKDCGATVLLTESSLAPRVHAFDGETLFLDEDWLHTDAAERLRPTALPSPASLAYIIYTSGSTGEPKGVAVEHRGLTNLVHWHRRAYEVTADDRATQYAGTSFDASVWEVWPYLTAGASVHVVEDDVRHSPAALLRWLSAKRVTLSFLPTPIAEGVLREPLPEGLELRVMLTGGDRLHGGLAKSLPFRLVNHYGPTENTVVSTGADVDLREALPPIGRPIDNVRVYVLDKDGKPVPIGVQGELYVGGDSLARGYWKRPELTAQFFVTRDLGTGERERLYRTGDLVRFRADGALEFLGRVDAQIKLRGFRIELGEIEALLGRQPDVEQAAVLCREDQPGDKRLVGYVKLVAGSETDDSVLRALLQAQLPAYMIPSVLVVMERLPLTPNGKVDRRALPPPDGTRRLAGEYVAPRDELEQRIAGIWRELLGLERVGVHDNFFDLGGHSLLLLQVQSKLNAMLESPVATVTLFHYPTISLLAAHLSGELEERQVRKEASDRVAKRKPATGSPNAIAIIGMAGRFPGARTIERFWQNLRTGVESIRFFSEEELGDAGISKSVRTSGAYVAARGFMDDAELFDAGIFGYSPREAEQLDPQQRVMLECAWEALENAGYDPDRYPGLVGVYAGASRNSYFIQQLRVAAAGGGEAPSALLSNTEFLPTRISYKLNLRGPSVNIQTACSTSLVAVHEACRSLLDQECDMALAGGVSVVVPRIAGYAYQPGGALSPDGHCRAFDVDAAGTVPGEGVALVVLKRLDDALTDGDDIRAVIRGTAINNDGSDKVGFTAPSVEGQAGAIALALATAGVDPESIGYIETHGTGTALGDPIEVAALTRVFGAGSDRRRRCVLGALKASIGHLDAAAGVAGLIKTVLALQHRELPPTVNFRSPNPKIDFESGPFEVNAVAAPWDAEPGIPRRAGVSSFGMGGTNAHVVLEEAPARPEAESAHVGELLVLSARTETALDAMCRRLAERLDEDAEPALSDVAYTLQLGRQRFGWRTAIPCGDRERAVAALRDPARRGVNVATSLGRPRLAFMFPGQGAQYPGMGAGLYREERIFRETVDRCCEFLRTPLALDLRAVLYPSDLNYEASAQQLQRTAVTQPALFVIEYALAQLWMSWGVRPDCMLGHSIGEYVAACIAGVMTLEDALGVVAARARLMDALPVGAMLAVALSEAEIGPMLDGQLSVASVNGPGLCVVSGSTTAIEALQARMVGEGLEPRRLRTSHAFHSPMMEPVLAEFTDCVGRVQLKPPILPYVSNVTGDWITPQQATDPIYYAQHMRRAVRFSEGLETVFASEYKLLLEVGPGRVLSGLASAHPRRAADAIAQPTLSNAHGQVSERNAMLEALGRLWMHNLEPDWKALHGSARRRRVSLPTYPFERQRYWLDAPQTVVQAASLEKKADVAQWFYLPSWRRVGPLEGAKALPQTRWLLFMDDTGFGERVAAALSAGGAEIVRVHAGGGFEQRNACDFAISMRAPEDFARLLSQLREEGRLPHRIGLLWLLTTEADCSGQTAEQFAQRGLYSLLFLAGALGTQGGDEPISLVVAANGLYDVVGSEVLHPDKATVIGPYRAIQAENPHVRCWLVDVQLDADCVAQDRQAAALVAEPESADAETVVAYRGCYRWVESATPRRLDAAAEGALPLREGGTYLITGGLGGVGLELARTLARRLRPNLVLVSRTALPERETWPEDTKHCDDGDPIARNVAAILALERMGATVLPCSADVANGEQMAAVIDKVKKRFGSVHGVIHAAGVPGGGVLLRQTQSTMEKVLAAKVTGTKVLDSLCRGENLDFFVLCSSLISFLSLAGRADYIAANAFVDAYARAESLRGRRGITALNWDTWIESGMARDARKAQGASDLVWDEGITDEEGAEAFLRALASGLPQIAVCVRDFDAMVNRARLERTPAIRSEARGGSVQAAVNRRYPRPALANEYEAPRSQTERKLVEIWQSLLGIEPIGVRDNFFDLGGDSVLGIQVAARANQAGLRLSPRQAFECQTIAELAVAATPAEASLVDAGPVTGVVPLTPIQAWFFEQRIAEPHYFNQSILLCVPDTLDVDRMERALGRLVEHHDALRCRFSLTGDGWQQRIDTTRDPVTLARFDMRGIEYSEQCARIESHGIELHASINLEKGPLIRAGFFRLGEHGARLLVVIHHLVVDAISWRVLTEDLRALYGALEPNRDTAGLPEKTTSWKSWSERLTEYASTGVAEEALGYWRTLRGVPVQPLPRDHIAGDNRVESTATIIAALNEAETSALMAGGKRTYRAQIDELLLAALWKAFNYWTRSLVLAVAYEGHGREAPFEGVDVSRTVGWFTNLYPIYLQSTPEAGPETLVPEIVDQARRARRHGLEYGVLRHLSPRAEVRATLAALPEPEVVFVYLGQNNASPAREAMWAPGHEYSGRQRSPANARQQLVEIGASVIEGRLTLSWTYSRACHDAATIERLTEAFTTALRSLIDYCGAVEMGSERENAAEFSAATLSDRDLTRIKQQVASKASPN